MIPGRQVYFVVINVKHDNKLKKKYTNKPHFEKHILKPWCALLSFLHLNHKRDNDDNNKTKKKNQEKDREGKKVPPHHHFGVAVPQQLDPPFWSK